MARRAAGTHGTADRVYQRSLCCESCALEAGRKAATLKADWAELEPSFLARVEAGLRTLEEDVARWCKRNPDLNRLVRASALQSINDSLQRIDGPAETLTGTGPALPIFG